MAGAEYAVLRKNFPQQLTEEKFSSVMEFLHSELGLVVFKKRSLAIPTPSPIGLKMVEDNDGRGRSERSLGILKSFLEGVAVGDKFGNNHANGREPARGAIYVRLKVEDEKLAEAFWSFYSTNNQFKLNKLSMVVIRTQTLSELAEENGNHKLALRLAVITNQLGAEIHGTDIETQKKIKPSYDETDSIEDKLKIVQFFEDKIIEAINLLS